MLADCVVSTVHASLCIDRVTRKMCFFVCQTRGLLCPFISFVLIDSDLEITFSTYFLFQVKGAIGESCTEEGSDLTTCNETSDFEKSFENPDVWSGWDPFPPFL